MANKVKCKGCGKNVYSDKCGFICACGVFNLQETKKNFFNSDFNMVDIKPNKNNKFFKLNKNCREEFKVLVNEIRKEQGEITK